MRAHGSAPPHVPDYELLREIGRGSYGAVWLARSVTGHYRAVKIVGRGSFEDREPYEREFRGITQFAAVSLASPRQLALLHVGRNDDAGFFYYVMELADDVTTGRDIDPARYQPHTLKEFGRIRGRLLAPAALELGLELAEGLAELHRHGLVHRDLKPSNIIFVGGAAKLADPGLVASARLADQTISRVGNAGYMPPDLPGVPSADVYGLGKILYELTTGRPREDFPRLPAALATFPDRRELLELNEVLLRACAPSAASRYPDAAALVDELRLLQAGKSLRRLRAAERHLGRALRAAALLAVAAIVAAGGAWIEHQRAAEENARRREAEAERDALARRAFYSAGVERAQRAIETGDHGRARALLADVRPKPGEPDLRGFEWQALWREAEGDPAVVLRDSGTPMQRVRWSADGALIAAQNADMNVTVWRAASREQVGTVANVFQLVGFSADGRWLGGVNRKVGLQRWSVETGQPDGPAVDEGRVNRPIALLADGRIACFTDGRDQPHAIRLWDFGARTEVARMLVPTDPPGTRWDFYRRDAVALTADGTRCAVALITGRAQHARWKLAVYDVRTGELHFSETTPHRITAVAFSPDQHHLAAAFGDTVELAVLNLTTRAWRWKRRVGGSQTTVLAYSPDGKMIAAGGAQIELVESARGESVARLRGHGSGVEDLAWSPRGDALVSAGAAGDVRIWPQLQSAPPTELTGLWIPAGGGRKVCLSPDGSLLAATDAPEKGALVLRTADFSVAGRGPAGWLPVAFDPDGSLLGFQTNGVMETRRWGAAGDAVLQSEARPFSRPVELGSSASASRDGGTIIVGSTGGSVAVWDRTHARQIALLDSGNTALSFATVSPDGTLALTGGSSKSHARLWAVREGRRLAQFYLPGSRPLAGGFSADGRLLALGWADGTVEIRFSDTGRLKTRIRSSSAFVQCLAFAPDGTRLACGAPNGTVHVFALEDDREVMTLRAGTAPNLPANSTVSNLAFSADGRVLAAYLNDGRIRIWRR